MWNQNICFDVALSYSDTDVWVAKDLHDLIFQYGFSVYCADRQPDYARGALRKKLFGIYGNSRVNVIIWSQSYARKPEDSIVAMEKDCIWERHVGHRDRDSLFILALDDTPLDGNLKGVLSHKLHEIGLVGARDIIILRLKELSPYITESGILCHPLTTEKDRGQLHPCSFFIKPDYKNDRLGRWRKLADIEVEVVGENFPPNFQVYLIPSGSATPLLRHSHILKTDPSLLERKRSASIKFAEEWMERELKGTWFIMKMGELDVPTVYSLEYDKFLNYSIHENCI